MIFGCLEVQDATFKASCHACHKKGLLLTLRNLHTKRMRCESCGNTTANAYPEWVANIENMAPEWADYPTFIEAVGPRPSPDHILIRGDSRRPFGPKNATKWGDRFDRMRPCRRVKARAREAFLRLHPGAHIKFEELWTKHGEPPTPNHTALTPHGWEVPHVPIPKPPPSKEDLKYMWGCEPPEDLEPPPTPRNVEALEESFLDHQMHILGRTRPQAQKEWEQAVSLWGYPPDEMSAALTPNGWLSEVTTEMPRAYWNGRWYLDPDPTDLPNPKWWEGDREHRKWWYDDQRLRAYAKKDAAAYQALDYLTRGTIQPAHYEAFERDTGLGIYPLPKEEQEQEQYPWE